MTERLQTLLTRLGVKQRDELEALGFDTNRSRKQLPPLQTLVAFEAAARLQSFTLAGNELGLTQPAVSQQVRLLEDRLGMALFTRSNNRVILTRQGEQLAGSVTVLLDHLTDSIDGLRADAGRALVSLSLLPSFASTWFAARAGGFETAHPDIDLVVFSTVACTEFGQEDVDAAIRWGKGGWSAYYEEKLLSERFILAAAPSLVERIGPIGSLQDLKGVPFVHDAAFTEWRALIERNGGDPADFAGGLHFGDTSATVAAIVSGHGIGAVRDVLVDHLIADGRLTVLPFEAVDGPLSYHFLCPFDTVERPEIQALLAWLRREAGVALAS